jgi:hypothetical protein
MRQSSTRFGISPNNSLFIALGALNIAGRAACRILACIASNGSGASRIMMSGCKTGQQLLGVYRFKWDHEHHRSTPLKNWEEINVSSQFLPDERNQLLPLLHSQRRFAASGVSQLHSTHLENAGSESLASSLPRESLSQFCYSGVSLKFFFLAPLLNF